MIQIKSDFETTYLVIDGDKFRSFTFARQFPGIMMCFGKMSKKDVAEYITELEECKIKRLEK